MTHDLQDLIVPSIISILFFVFGFFVTADLLDLSVREMMVGVFAGVVCGVTVLCAVLHQAARTDATVPLPTY